MLVEQVSGPGNAEALRLARAIADRSRDSLGMIQAALEMTRSEVRHSSLDAGDIDVRALLQRIAAETHVPGEKVDLTVIWDVAERLPPLRADAIKVEMVLKNLVGNAIKFTERGTIRITVVPLEGALRFMVADSGIGIAEADLPNLFAPFMQAHGSHSRRAGGVGLGLYIVSRLVDLLGGTVTVESRPRSGTTFTVTIPLTGPLSN